MPENPKMVGSGLVSARVQTGPCPNHCPECYYNGPDGKGLGYCENIFEPHIPTPEEAMGKLVRMNDGHDSNISRDLVMATARELIRQGARGAYMNTSIPRFDFEDGQGGKFPVIFTCNGRQPVFVDDCPKNLMAVRLRWNSWEHGAQAALVHHYLDRRVPVIITPMRYREPWAMPPDAREHDYEWRQHILNPYWCVRPELLKRKVDALMASFHYSRELVLCEGRCAECGNCARLYKQCVLCGCGYGH